MSGVREFYGIAMALMRDPIGNLNGIANGSDDMVQMTDIDNTEVASTQPRVSRLWRRAADIVFIIITVIGAIPVAKFGIGDVTLIMFAEFYSILIFVVGLRDYADIMLSANQTSGDPPHWLTPAKSMLVMAIFLASLLGAAAAISWLSVSAPIRLMLLFGIAAVLWALMRRLGQSCLFPSELKACEP